MQTDTPAAGPGIEPHAIGVTAKAIHRAFGDGVELLVSELITNAIA